MVGCACLHLCALACLSHLLGLRQEALVVARLEGLDRRLGLGVRPSALLAYVLRRVFVVLTSRSWS
jgi:hypothetical protein